MTNQGRLVGRWPVGSPLFQLRMDVAQEEKGLHRLIVALLFIVAAAGLLLLDDMNGGLCQKVSGSTNSPDQLQLVVDGVESRQAIDLVQSGRVVAGPVVR